MAATVQPGRRYTCGSPAAWAMRSTAIGSVASWSSTTSGSRWASTAPRNARRPSPPNRMLYETRRTGAVSPRGRRTASPAAPIGGRGTSAPSPGARRPAGDRLGGGARLLERRLGDVAGLVVQGLGVHPRKIEGIGRPRCHRLLADEDDVEVAGPGTVGVERLAGLVALPLDRGATEGEPGARRDAGLERRHEPCEPVEVAAERALDRPREQRGLLRARRPQRRDRRLERRGMVERRPDVLELDLGMRAPDLVEAAVEVEEVGIAQARARVVDRESHGDDGDRGRALVDARGHGRDRLGGRGRVGDRRVVVVLADRGCERVEAAGLDRRPARRVERRHLVPNRPPHVGPRARVPRDGVQPRHAVGRRARRSGDDEDEAHARMLDPGR